MLGFPVAEDSCELVKQLAAMSERSSVRQQLLPPACCQLHRSEGACRPSQPGMLEGVVAPNEPLVQSDCMYKAEKFTTGVALTQHNPSCRL